MRDESSDGATRRQRFAGGLPGRDDRRGRRSASGLAIAAMTAMAAFATLALAGGPARAGDAADAARQVAEYKVWPVGWVRKAGGRSWIEIEPRYQPAMLGLDKLSTIQVLYWFDRNDTPEQRAILQVHPRGNPDNPLRGVFATRSPFRPNLIALSEVKVIAVKGNRIEIADIDAFADTPVLDIKP